MKRVLMVAGAIVLIGAMGYVAWLNPVAVEFRFATNQLVRVPLGWLLVFAFVSGGVLTLLAASLQQLGQLLARWRRRRAERRAARITEWETTGAALAWDGELERARTLLRKASRRRPDSHGAALALAASYMDTGEFAAARAILEEAVVHGASDTDVRHALSEAVRQSGDLTEAIRILETVRVQHPRSPRALAGLRDLYAQAGRWQEAAQAQEAYLAVLPEPGRAAAERTRLLHFRYQAAVALESPSARIEALSAVLETDRSFVPAAVSLGDALVACRRVDDATRLWERAVREQPRTVLIERLLAQQKTPRERQRVLSLLKKHRQPLDERAVQYFAARVALDDGNVDAAAAALEADTASDTTAAQRLWAEVHRRRGQFDQALTAFAKVADHTAALVTGYRCTACGRVAEAWSGHCPGCGRWDSFRSSVELTAPGPP